MAVFEQRVGDHAAQRVQPEPGSDLEAHLSKLAEDREDNWVRVKEPEPEPAEPTRPAKTDNKTAWVDWAVSQGAEEDEAKAATKDDLIKAYGG
jgi:hypothetical protein